MRYVKWSSVSRVDWTTANRSAPAQPTSSPAAWAPLRSGSWLYLQTISKSTLLSLPPLLSLLSTDVDQNSRMMAASHNAPRPSFALTLREINRVAGVRGFFAGLTPCILRAFPANACAMYAYEGLMRTFGAEKVCFES